MSGYNVTDTNLPINSNNTCKDIHECLDSVSVCGLNSYCYNYNGSFSCFCWEGYNVSDVNKDISKSNPCIDINECLFSPSVCGPNANCTNEIGSYNCSCLDGFTATNSSLSISINNICKDVDECVEISDVCGPNSICNNTVGSYNCSCMSGYNVTDPNLPINNNNPCKDIHECLDSESVCGPNSHCYNYNGSFSCFCWGGYNVSDGNKAISKGNPCTDIDECLLSPSVCGPNANCTNEMGSYNCSCLDGFTVTNSSLSISINNTCRGFSDPDGYDVLCSRATKVEVTRLPFLRHSPPGCKRMSVAEVKALGPKQKVGEVRGKVRVHSSLSRMVTVRGSDVELKEVVICDGTGEISVTLWDSYVNQAEGGKSYAFKNLCTRERDGSIRLCTGPGSTIEQIADLEVPHGEGGEEEDGSKALFSATLKGIDVVIQRKCSS
ncbi:hypothetical protein cypCar_00047470 [Cyprinus carpio]|nr:hypothetical protein cypCar_00047470 [Cyprinus carpio]